MCLGLFHQKLFELVYYLFIKHGGTPFVGNI